MITLTEEAKTKISSMLSDADSSKALRVFIEPGGCSGFEGGMSTLPRKATIVSKFQDYMWQSVRTALIT